MNLKLNKNHGSLYIALAIFNVGIGVVCWNVFSVLNLAVGAWCLLNAFEDK